MPATTGDILAAEVFWRIGGKLTTAQLGPYLNRALNLIEFGGQYEWDVVQTSFAPGAGTGIFPTPATLDIGKDVFCLNQSDGSPITRLTVDKAWKPDNTYSSTTTYDSWYIDGSVAAPGQMNFRPLIAPPATVIVIYHKLPMVLDGTAGTLVPWTQKWMDDLLCDLAEMEIKRIANWVGWPELEQRSLARLKEAIARFSSERMVASLVEQVQAPTPKGN